MAERKAPPGAEPAGTLFDAHESFRDELASVQRDGRRRWIYARQPSGSFYRARTVVSVFLLAFLFLAPFVHVAGRPLVLLDFIDRRFVILGLAFWPQDFYLVVLGALTGLVTVVLLTATVGRIWCGWLCPQTVFLEMVFRRIEYWIDGSAEQQIRRVRALAGRSGWRDPATVRRRIVKHGVFFALSFLIANVFLAYIIGAGALWTIVTDPPAQHVVGLFAITVFSLLFYGVFARFREQACTLACPYGRVMSALQDARTVTVTYDWKRGEPRGRRLHAVGDGAEEPHGDCIDCGQCVTVCPTGIDIRNGIQLECVNCAACIDACSSVMQRLDRPTGLIRLTSHDAIAHGRAGWLTARVKAYAAVWVVLAAVFVGLVLARRDVDVLILRQPGTLYAAAGSDAFANFYNVQVINRTTRPQALEYRVVSPGEAQITPLGTIDRAAPDALVDSRLLLTIPGRALTGPSTPVTFEIRANGRIVQTVRSSFLGPAAPDAAPESKRTP